MKMDDITEDEAAGTVLDCLVFAGEAASYFTVTTIIKLGSEIVIELRNPRDEPDDTQRFVISVRKA